MMKKTKPQILFYLIIDVLLVSIAFSASTNQCKSLFKPESVRLQTLTNQNQTNHLIGSNAAPVQKLTTSKSRSRALIKTEKAQHTAQVFKFVNLIKGKDFAISKLLRSNPVQYWAHSYLSANRYIDQKWLNFKGFVVGDGHNGNFSFILFAKKVVYRFVDNDLLGKAPLILDFSRFLASVLAVDPEMASLQNYKLLVEAYISGIQNKNFEEPSFISEYSRLSDSEYTELLEEKTDKETKNKKIKTDGLQNIEVSDLDLKMYLSEKIELAMPGVKVIDIAQRTKIKGSSAEVERYLVYLKNQEGQKLLYEIKEHEKPFVFNLFNRTQPKNTEFDIELALDKNLQSDTNYQVLNLLIKNKNVEFIFRPKQLYFFDFANEFKDTKSRKNFQALSIYNAYQLGRIHGRSNLGYNLELQNELSSPFEDTVFFAQVLPFVLDYISSLEEVLKQSDTSRND